MTSESCLRRLPGPNDKGLILKALEKEVDAAVAKALATFKNMVKERGDWLRSLTYEQVNHLTDAPFDYIAVHSRRAKIATIVQRLPSDGFRVVVQGFMKKRFLPMAWNVELDGFYKYPDETTAPLTREDLWEFD